MWALTTVLFVNQSFESEIHGTVNFTYFCFCCAIFAQGRIQQMCAIERFDVDAWFNTFGEIRVKVKSMHPSSRINSR